MKKVSGAKKLLAAFVLVPALALAGCSSTGGKQATATSAPGAGTANTARIKIALITHAAAGDTFWDTVRKGAESAATKDNAELLYSSDPDGTKQAALVQTAIDQKVDGIVVSLAKPDAMASAIKAAGSAGIPVYAINAGGDKYKEVGALNYFGSDETVAGEAVGERLNEIGTKKNICIIHEQGHVGLEARCAGVKKAFKGTTEILYVNGADDSDVTSKVTAKVQSDKDVDMLIGLGAPLSLLALNAAGQTGYTGKVGSFDMNADLAQLIVDKKIAFGVDQQPWLQGYLGVDAAWLKKNGGFAVGGGLPVLTGPAIIDENNAKDVVTFAKAGIR